MIAGIIAVIIVIFIIILVIEREHMIKMNIISILSVKRGLLTPNKYWWAVSDLLLRDTTGVELFYKIKKDHPYFYKTSLLTKSIILVLNIDIIVDILKKSPDIFNAGTFKFNFFKSFMTNNIGILKGKKWKSLRGINENVLDTGHTHRYINKFNDIIQNSLINNKLPMNFNDFSSQAKSITSKIIFGVTDFDQHYLYNTLTEANKLPVSLCQNSSNKVFSYDNSLKYIDKISKNPINNTLFYLLVKYGKDISKHNKSSIMLDQIYHFIFPILGLITVHVPRILALIFVHSEVKNKIFSNLHNPNEINLYLRKCILETLRLNSPVVSFFRKTSCPMFGFPSNTDFMALTNPILRDPVAFSNPNLFIPERWTADLVHSKYNLIFGIGPQRCPGKDLVLDILQYYLYKYIFFTQHLSLYVKNEKILYKKYLKPQISYAINPYKIVLCTRNKHDN